MTKIILDDKTEVEDLDTILEEQKKFYEHLYRSRNPKMSDKFKKTFFPDKRDHIPKIKDEDKAFCEGNITEGESVTAKESYWREDGGKEGGRKGCREKEGGL